MHIHKPVFTAAVILCAGAGFASATSPSRTPAPISIAAPDATANYDAGIARTSLSDHAVKIEEATGGRILEIHWLHGPGHGFEAVVAKPDAVGYIRLNPLTDKLVVLRSEETPQWMLPWKLRLQVRSIAQAKVPLAAAIQIAEGATRSIAVDGALAKPLTGANNVLAYQITVLRGGRPDLVGVDAVTGQIIANPDYIFDVRTPEKVLEEQTVQWRD